MKGMAEDVAAKAFADRSAVLGGAAEHGGEVGPVSDKFRQHDAGVPGIVRHQRQHIESCIVGAAVVDDFDGGAHAVDEYFRATPFAKIIRRK